MVIVNLNQSVTVAQQTYSTPQGNVTSTLRTCASSFLDPFGIFCQLSGNQAAINPVTTSSPITVTPNNTPVVVQQTTSKVSIVPNDNKPVIIQSTTNDPLVATTTTGQTITSPTITVSSGVIVSSSSSFTVDSSSGSTVTLAPTSGGTITVASNTGSVGPNDQCTNGGIKDVNGVCPLSVIQTNVCTTSQINQGYTIQGTASTGFTCQAPPPVCSADQLSKGYTVSGTTCVAPPVCSADQLSKGYTVSGTTCVAPPESLSISSNAYLIDNNGNNQTINGSPLPFQIPSSFIALSNTATNIDHGSMGMILKLTGTPNTSYQLNAMLRVKINGQDLHPQGIIVGQTGFTDSNGILLLNLQTPSGLTNKYSLSINDHASQISQSTNTLSFTLSNLSITNLKTGKTYSDNTEKTLLTVNMDYNANQIIKTNSNGQLVRGYPDDDKAILAGLNIPEHQQGVRTCSAKGCSYNIYDIPTVLGPDMGTMTVYLENGGFERLLGSVSVGAGNNQLLHVDNIPWDSDIRVVLSKNGYDKTFHTPNDSHHEWEYSCDVNSCSNTFP